MKSPALLYPQCSLPSGKLGDLSQQLCSNIFTSGVVRYFEISLVRVECE